MNEQKTKDKLKFQVLKENKKYGFDTVMKYIKYRQFNIIIFQFYEQ